MCSKTARDLLEKGYNVFVCNLSETSDNLWEEKLLNVAQLDKIVIMINIRTKHEVAEDIIKLVESYLRTK